MDEDEVKEKLSSFDIPHGTDPVEVEKIISGGNDDPKMEKEDSSSGDRERKQSSVSCDKSDSIRTDSDIESVSSQPDTSTPLHKNVRVNPSQSTVQFDIDASSLISESRLSSDFKETISPEDVKVPIMGYEIMEERAKFTVFKIKVEKEGNTWFVFRRYTDFVQLNNTLRKLFPKVRFSLPPKRWFKDNFDKNFIEDRLLGLQAFVDNCTCHKDICNCYPVREFFCFDDPPGPHESLEESRAVCESLEDSVYRLRHELEEKDIEVKLLQEELSLYKKQVEMLTAALRSKNASARSLESQESASSKSLESPDSPGSTSLAECDLMTCPEADQSHMQKQDASATSQEEIAPETQEKSREKKKMKSNSIFKFRKKQTS